MGIQLASDKFQTSKYMKIKKVTMRQKYHERHDEAEIVER